MESNLVVPAHPSDDEATRKLIAPLRLRIASSSDESVVLPTIIAFPRIRIKQP